MPCDLTHENRLRGLGCRLVAGIDEAGRGPLAGPVVAAAVILPMDYTHLSLDDSKKLTAAHREQIFAELTAQAGIAWSVAIVDPLEIDRINILQATHRAMRDAVEGLAVRPDHALIDGLPVRQFPVNQTALVGGDGLSFSIAAASVIAKVTRDRLMLEMDRAYPEYGFARHKGYATALHLARLQQHGPCPIHRRSFAPVAQRWLAF